MTAPQVAFFRRESGAFVGNDAARSPWQADACHGGPVAGLFAGLLESVVADKQLVRMTISFQRPVPIAGVAVEPEVVRDGRSSAETRARLTDAGGRLCAEATGLHIAPAETPEWPTADASGPDFAAAARGVFPVQRPPHGMPFFGNAIEVAYPPGERGGPGPATMWMRTPAIVEGDAPTRFQIACPIADCGNGISRNAGFDRASFINPDLTVALHRLPASDWLASSAVSHWQPNGIGLSAATLYDTRGAIGSALQTLIVRPLPAGSTG